MLGQGIIAWNNCIGLLEQLLSSVVAISTQNTTLAPVQNVNGVADDATTDTDPSAIDSIVSLIQSSGKHLDLWLGWG